MAENGPSSPSSEQEQKVGRGYYAVLGVSETANLAEIKAARRRQMLNAHPDLNQKDPHAHTKASDINEAYEVLSDETKRAAYDAQLGKEANAETLDQKMRQRIGSFLASAPDFTDLDSAVGAFVRIGTADEFRQLKDMDLRGVVGLLMNDLEKIALFLRDWQGKTPSQEAYDQLRNKLSQLTVTVQTAGGEKVFHSVFQPALDKDARRATEQRRVAEMNRFEAEYGKSGQQYAAEQARQAAARAEREDQDADWNQFLKDLRAVDTLPQLRKFIEASNESPKLKTDKRFAPFWDDLQRLIRITDKLAAESYGTKFVRRGALLDAIESRSTIEPPRNSTMLEVVKSVLKNERAKLREKTNVTEAYHRIQEALAKLKVSSVQEVVDRKTALDLIADLLGDKYIDANKVSSSDWHESVRILKTKAEEQVREGEPEEAKGQARYVLGVINYLTRLRGL